MVSSFVRTAKDFGHGAMYAIYKSCLPRRGFVFDNKKYTYFYHRYNNSCENERSIEIPIALEFLARQPVGTVLEVGNVLNHYSPFQHTVVDKYEVATDVINLDIAEVDFAQTFASIISISTMEHVGWDEDLFEPQKAVRAISHLRRLLLPGGAMLVSFPIGHNSGLDNALHEGTLGCVEVRGMKRKNFVKNDWAEVAVSELLSCRMENPYRKGPGPYRRPKGVAFAYFGA